MNFEGKTLNSFNLEELHYNVGYSCKINEGGHFRKRIGCK
jgi:hypothetical protein